MINFYIVSNTKFKMVYVSDTEYNGNHPFENLWNAVLKITDYNEEKTKNFINMWIEENENNNRWFTCYEFQDSGGYSGTVGSFNSNEAFNKAYKGKGCFGKITGSYKIPVYKYILSVVIDRWRQNPYNFNPSNISAVYVYPYGWIKESFTIERTLKIYFNPFKSSCCCYCKAQHLIDIEKNKKLNSILDKALNE